MINPESHGEHPGRRAPGVEPNAAGGPFASRDDYVGPVTEQSDLRSKLNEPDEPSTLAFSCERLL